MMKKYIEPAIEVINIETRQMLAGSPGVSSTDVQAGDPILSRGGRYDDEEEEEEW